MKNLKKLRKNINKTQAEMAEILKIKRATYARYENNETQPDFETLQNLADYFGCSIDYLIGRKNFGENSSTKNDLLNAIGTLTDGECEKVLSFIKGMRS